MNRGKRKRIRMHLRKKSFMAAALLCGLCLAACSHGENTASPEVSVPETAIEESESKMDSNRETGAETEMESAAGNEAQDAASSLQVAGFYPVPGEGIEAAGYAGKDYFFVGADPLQIWSVREGEFLTADWEERFQFSGLASQWGDVFPVTDGYVGAMTLEDDIVLALWDAQFALREVINLSAELSVDMRFHDIDVSADGKCAVYADVDGLHLYHLDTRQKEDLIAIDYENGFESSQGIIGFTSCGFIEDGQKVLFLAAQNELPVDQGEETFEAIGFYDLEEHRMEVSRAGDLLLDRMDVFDGFALIQPGTELDGTYENVFYRYDEQNGIQAFALAEEGEANSLSPSLDGKYVTTRVSGETAETFRVYASDTGQLLRVGRLERAAVEEALGGEILWLGDSFLLGDGQSLMMTVSVQDAQGNVQSGLLEIRFA